MSFLSNDSILFELKNGNLVINYDESNISQGAYELSLGDEYYTSSTTNKIVDLLTDQKRQLIIEPGQIALLLTMETVKIPSHLIALISIKASKKMEGLLNVSGFHVDPGFEGQLKFAVFNSGPNDIVLDRGEPYFLIWFATFDTPLKDDQLYGRKNSHYQQHNINAEDIMRLRGELTSPNFLNKRLESLHEKQQFTDWLLKAILILILGILIKFFIEWDINKEIDQKIDSKFRENNSIQDKTDLIETSTDTVSNLPDFGEPSSIDSFIRKPLNIINDKDSNK